MPPPTSQVSVCMHVCQNLYSNQFISESHPMLVLILEKKKSLKVHSHELFDHENDSDGKMGNLKSLRQPASIKCEIGVVGLYPMANIKKGEMITATNTYLKFRYWQKSENTLQTVSSCAGVLNKMQTNLHRSIQLHPPKGGYKHKLKLLCNNQITQRPRLHLLLRLDHT